MEEDTTSASINGVVDLNPPLVTETDVTENQLNDKLISESSVEKSEEVSECANVDCKDESGVVLDVFEDAINITVNSNDCVNNNEHCEVNDDARSLGDLDSLPAGDELVLGAAGSDSGVEGCGRALSSGGGSRSCASSVVSCGSGCGSESSSVAGAPPRPRRRVNVVVTEPKRSSPIGSSTPRPVTAPRGPNLATRERARSREKPAIPEKPRPLTPKPRIRPSTDLPNLVRESPALRAKPTKTSTARCRTPNSPNEEKRWPSNGSRLTTVTDASATRVAADKYGTLPRRRRDPDSEGSPKHESTPPVTSRRPTVTRSVSSRSATKTRVKIYAEKVSQTVLTGEDVESAFAGVVPNIESRIEVSRCSRGVQASSRDSELARLTNAAAAAEGVAEAERARRLQAEALLAAERAARLAACAELESNTQRLLELAGGSEGGADGSLRALEAQLRSARELAARQQTEIDALRTTADKLQLEVCTARESSRVLQCRLEEAEREAAEMQDFLAAETGALGDSLRDAEAELEAARAELQRRRAECRQLVRLCEQRRQEALAAAARARCGAGALAALDAVARRVQAACDAARDPHSCSENGEAPSPEEGGRVPRAAHEDERSRLSDDCSAELLDSETEPCLVTDPECAEEWWSGGAWSGDELSPERECVAELDREPESASASERDSLRNLSAAIALRQRSETDESRAALLERVARLDSRLALLAQLVTRDKMESTEKCIADVVVKKLTEIDATKTIMEQYTQMENLNKQLPLPSEDDELALLEEELTQCDESERRARYEALDAALSALAARRGAVRGWPRLAALQRRLEALAFALAAPPPTPPPVRTVAV